MNKVSVVADDLSVRADDLSVRADNLSVRADCLSVRADCLSVRADCLSVRADCLSVRAEFNQTIDGNCAIATGKYNADNLASLQMPALVTVNGILSLEGYSSYYFNSKLTDLNGFAALRTVKGITVSWNTGLKDFTGLKDALPSVAATEWKVANNGYNPTYQDMMDGKYVKP